ncbi:MAG: hypothetical protein GEU71_09470 [Actinobacteria bacterium]|nr:hypothetical protein [Actinomycetota bacterium]
MITMLRRRQALSFLAYVCAIPLALVHEYLGLGLITGMWGFWGWIAYGNIGKAVIRRRAKRT